MNRRGFFGTLAGVAAMPFTKEPEPAASWGTTSSAIYLTGPIDGESLERCRKEFELKYQGDRPMQTIILNAKPIHVKCHVPEELANTNFFD